MSNTAEIVSIEEQKRMSTSDWTIKKLQEMREASFFCDADKFFDYKTLNHVDAVRKLEPEHFGVNEYVYALSNPMMPGLLKIGKTTRSVEHRVNELSAPTGVPASFKIESVFITDNCTNLEECIHDDLAEYRVSGNREFFKCSVEQFEDIARGYAIRQGEDASLFFHHKRYFTDATTPERFCESVKVNTKVMENIRELMCGDQSTIISGLLDFALQHYTESLLFTVEGKANLAYLFKSHESHELDEHFKEVQENG